LHNNATDRTFNLRTPWLNDIVYVGSGYLVEGGIAHRVAQVV